MSKISSSMSNLEEEDERNDLVDFDNVPTFGKKQRDFTLLSADKRKSRSSMSDAKLF